MSTSKTYQQSLVDAGSETRKWLNKALDEGPYQFEMFIPNNSTVLKLQTAEDLQGDALLALVLDGAQEPDSSSIPNDIYNSVDACTLANDMWKRVKRLMRGTIQNKVDRELVVPMNMYQFVSEQGSLIYLQPEWLKYVTQVRLAKRLTVDTFDDLFDYLQQFEKLVNVSRAKKLEKSHDPLALQDDVHITSAMLLLARAITQKFSTPTNNHLRTSSNTRNQAIIQGDRVNIQSRNSGNAGRNNRRAYVQEEIVEGSNAPNETGNVQRTLRTSSLGNTSTVQCYNCSGKGHYARNCPKPRVRDSKYFMEQMLLAKQDEAGVILTNEKNDFLFADASRMEEIEELSANICLMARIQPADNTSDVGPSYDSAFISEVQSSSNTENEEQMYPTHTKIINSTIGDDQIDSDIIFDSPNGNVNSGSIEKDTHVPDLYNSLHAEIEQLKKKSIEIQEGLQARIKFLKKMFKVEKLEDKNMSLDFTVQYLIKERDNVKLEYQKLFNSIKKTRSQTQTEMDELIAHVTEKTYAYGAIRVENQNLLFNISELKSRQENAKKGKFVNTKFDKTNGSQHLFCVTPLNKHVIQKKTDVQKSKENHVVSKPVTLQTSPAKQSGVNSNKNVIAPGMYKVVTTHESQTNEAKHDLSSTGMNDASSVRRPMNRDSHWKGFSGRVTPLFPTMVVQNQAELGEGSAIPTDPHHTPTIIESSSQPQKTQKPRKPNRKDTRVPQPSDPSDNVADEAVHKELGDNLVRAATTVSSLEAEQDNGNITKTRSKATPNESSSLGTTSGGGPKRQETMRDTIAQTKFENVSKHSNDPLLAGARVESFEDEESLGEDASKQGRINAIDADEDITLVNDQDDADMFDVNTLTSDEDK
ncbi:integrase, catalytic region, zinc finger, CCHC-type containing protein [Tanacetum coccineum]|uniref:Integrase, catalytic region, zinc finger, CCHC-type containing protein n=1 Tax=Tanacetum coccineum TaxID=301880 RepID=A0ABQ5IQ99_9ASTR